jgi:hypothetical protein
MAANLAIPGLTYDPTPPAATCRLPIRASAR